MATKAFALSLFRQHLLGRGSFPLYQTRYEHRPECWFWNIAHEYCQQNRHRQKHYLRPRHQPKIIEPVAFKQLWSNNTVLPSVDAEGNSLYGSHEKLIYYFESSEDEDFQKIGELLKTMKIHRTTADYKCRKRQTLDSANIQIEIANEALLLLDNKLLKVVQKLLKDFILIFGI